MVKNNVGMEWILKHIGYNLATILENNTHKYILLTLFHIPTQIYKILSMSLSKKIINN